MFFDGNISPMSISTKDVQYIAALARIHVPDEKLEVFAKELSNIVGYVEQLQSLNVDHVTPTTHAVPLGNVLRDDIVLKSLTNQEALGFAVEKVQGSFKVPLVIE